MTAQPHISDFINIDGVMLIGVAVAVVILTFYMVVGIFTGHSKALGKDTYALDQQASTMLFITRSTGILCILSSIVGGFAYLLFLLAGTTEPEFWQVFFEIVGLLFAIFISPLIVYGIGRILGSIVAAKLNKWGNG